MGITISTDILDKVGIAYSAIGVALALFQTFVRKTHSRSLDYIQWTYVLYLANKTSLTGTFSSYLYIGYSLINLDQQLLNSFYCPLDNYVCLMAFALSFASILAAVILIMRFITIPEKVRDSGFTFTRVYRFFKGLFKWVYLPLLFTSITTSFTSATISIPALSVLGILIIFPVVQIILYKNFDPESENIFIKWLQFCSYLKTALFGLLVAVALVYSSFTYYLYISILIASYAIFFAIKADFQFPIAGRVMYILGQVIFYFLFSLLASGSVWVQTYFIDLFGLGIIVVLDIIYLIMEASEECKKRRSQADIIPENSQDRPGDKSQQQIVVEDGNAGNAESKEYLPITSSIGAPERVRRRPK